MSCVIDFTKERHRRDMQRRWRTEPAAAVVLLTDNGKIAAFAGKPEKGAAETPFGEEDEAYWQPFSLAQELADNLRSHPAMRMILDQGFRIEAIHA